MPMEATATTTSGQPNEGGCRPSTSTRCTKPFPRHAMWSGASVEGQLRSPTQSNEQLFSDALQYSSLVHT